MRYRLSTLCLVITVVAVMCGWYSDRTRLATENRRLNDECAELFSSLPIVYTVSPKRLSRMGSVGDEARFEKMLYDAHDPVDRANYREERPAKLLAR